MCKNLIALTMLFSLIPHTVIAEDAEVLAELDAVWAEVSRTVVEGDFDGMAAVYHEDAVLVKKNGAWKMIMEHQKSLATIEEWDALATSVD